MDDNFYFNKKIPPANLKLINYINFDYLMEDNLNLKDDVKILLIKDKDENTNRNVSKKAEIFAQNNPKIKFYHMYNTNKNMKIIKQKYKLEFESYPQMIIIKNNKVEIIPQHTILSSSFTDGIKI
jgi:hypothetical protein